MTAGRAAHRRPRAAGRRPVRAGRAARAPGLRHHDTRGDRLGARRRRQHRGHQRRPADRVRCGPGLRQPAGTPCRLSAACATCTPWRLAMRDPYVHAEKTALPGFGHQVIRALLADALGVAPDLPKTTGRLGCAAVDQHRPGRITCLPAGVARGECLFWPDAAAVARLARRSAGFRRRRISAPERPSRKLAARFEWPRERIRHPARTATAIRARRGATPTVQRAATDAADDRRDHQGPGVLRRRRARARPKTTCGTTTTPARRRRPDRHVSSAASAAPLPRRRPTGQPGRRSRRPITRPARRLAGARGLPRDQRQRALRRLARGRPVRCLRAGCPSRKTSPSPTHYDRPAPRSHDEGGMSEHRGWLP